MMWLTIVSSVPFVIVALVLGAIAGFLLGRRRVAVVDSDESYELAGLRELRGNLRHQLREADDTLQHRTEALKAYETETAQLRQRVAELEQQLDPEAIAAAYAGLDGHENPTVEDLLIQGEQLRQRLRDEMNELRDRLEELERDSAEYEEQLARKDEEIAKRQQAIEALERELQDKGQFIENVENDLSHHRSWVQNLEKQLGEHQARVDSLQWELKDKQDQLEALGASLNARSEERTALQHEVTQSRDRISTLDQELKLKLEEREENEQKLRAQVAELSQALHVHEQNVTKLTQDLRSERDRASEHETSARSLENRLKQREQVLQSTQRDAQLEQESNRAHKEQLKQQEADLKELGDARKSLEVELSEQRATQTDLQAQLETATLDLSNREAALAELRESLAREQAHTEAVQHAAEEQQATLTQLQDELEQKRTEISELRVRFEREKNENQSAHALAQTDADVQRIAAEQRQGELEQQLKDQTTALEALQERFEQQQANAAQRKAALEALEAELIAAREQLAAREQALSSESESLRNAQEQTHNDKLRSLNGQVEQLTASLAACEQEVGALHQQLIAGAQVPGASRNQREDDVALVDEELSAAAKNLAQAAEETVEVARRREQRFAALGAGLAEASRGLKREANGQHKPEQDDALSARLKAIAGKYAVGHEDDLSRLSGIAPKLAALLSEQGVRNYLQLSLLDAPAQRALEQRLELTTERLLRDNWSGQAAQLHKEHHQQDLQEALCVPPSAQWVALVASGDRDHLSRRLRELKDGQADEDDLTKIREVDPELSRALNSHGVLRYKQLALLDDAAVDALETRLDRAPGDLRRANWVSQAAQLHFEAHGEALYEQVQVHPVYDNALQRMLAESARGKRLNYRDDLKKIKGLGPKMEVLLNESGLHTYWQLSQLDVSALDTLDGGLDSLANRIRRGKWVQQAATLHRKYHNS